MGWQAADITRNRRAISVNDGLTAGFALASPRKWHPYLDQGTKENHISRVYLVMKMLLKASNRYLKTKEIMLKAFTPWIKRVRNQHTTRNLKDPASLLFAYHFRPTKPIILPIALHHASSNEIPFRSP
ncbi:uncharacterized protein G2W53_009654 [Senna tora]|uniref:Uncharacterized protein n=1 Tax=Senna tora TaxID=362788 RepID=A0A835CAA4_9FABA|nr:uncharacterized protein G2W53_009654 [Senna tora]